MATTYWALIDGGWREVSHASYLERLAATEQVFATVTPPPREASGSRYWVEYEADGTPVYWVNQCGWSRVPRDVYQAAMDYRPEPAPPREPKPPRARSQGPAKGTDHAKDGPPHYLEDNARLNWWSPELTAKQHAAIARFDADCAHAALEETYKPWRAKWGYRPRYDGLRDPDPLEVKKGRH